MSFLSRVPRIPVVLRLWFYRRYNPWRLRVSGCKIGDGSNIINSIYLFREPEASIEIGDNFTFTSGDGFNPLCRNIKGALCARGKGRIKIGNNVGMSSTAVWATDSIEIGNRVNVGANCYIMDNDAHNLSAAERRDTNLSKCIAHAPIVIEDEVFIGMNCIILKGVTIGARSVIGAGSVVTKSIPADCVAAGNPCRVIRRLDEKHEESTSRDGD